MIGVDVQPRTPLITSVPSMSGSPRSSISTSGRSRAIAASPDAPSAAVLTWYLRAVRLILSARRIGASSSITRTFVMVQSSRPGRHAGCAWRRARQRDLHGQPATGSIGGPDRAPHGVEEAPDDREPQADPGPAGRIAAAPVQPLERLEHAVLELIRHAAAVVDDLEHDRVAGLVRPQARPLPFW